MDTSSGINASLAGRYAGALFALSKDAKNLPVVEQDIEKLAQNLDESPQFQQLLTSQTITRKDAIAITSQIAKVLELSTHSANLLGVMADNRRLAQLPAVIRVFRDMVANHRGEMTAQVTSAYSLTETQLDEIKKQLKSRAGRDIRIVAKTDPDILGGLIVRLGSQMIDSSIKTRLNTLAQAMKG